MPEEKTLSSKAIFTGRAVRLRVDQVQMPSGRLTTREVVEHDDCVAIVALDEGGNVLLVDQFRQAVGQNLLEIPAGGIDPGEDADAAVRREMREETGFMPGRIEPMGGFYSTPGYCTEYLYLYLATDLTPSPLQAEDTEVITVVKVPLKDVLGLITSHRIRDAKSIAGLLFYLQRQANS